MPLSNNRIKRCSKSRKEKVAVPLTFRRSDLQGDRGRREIGTSNKVLSREDSTVLTCIGCGDQARGQIEGILAVRPIQRIHLVGRDKDRARPLLDWLATQALIFPNA